MRTLAHWRFDEITQALRPVDTIGAVADLTPLAYPATSEEMRMLAGGRGGYSVGFHCDDVAAPVHPKFGGPSLLHAFGVAPTFGVGGALGGLDRAIRLPPQGGVCILSGGDSFDVPAAEDLIAFWVASHSAFAAVPQVFIGKDNAASNRWFVEWEPATGKFRNDVGDGVDVAITRIDPPAVNARYVGGLAWSRLTNRLNFGWRTFDGVAVSSGLIDVSAVGAVAGAGNFVWGSSFGVDALQDMDVSFLALGVGAGYAEAIPENFSSTLQSIVDGLLNQPALVTAAVGRGRSFVALSRNGYAGDDVTAGSTLAARDCSVQALVKWDLAKQAAAQKWRLSGGDTVGWDAHARSAESYNGELILEMEVGQEFSYSMLGFRRASDATEGLAGNNHFAYLSQNTPPNELILWESNAQTFGTGANGYRLGDRVRVKRTAAGVFSLWRKQGAAGVWTNLATGGTDAAAMVVSATSLNGFSDPFAEITLTVDGVRTAFSWKHLAEYEATPTDHRGTLYARGAGDSFAQYMSAGVELRPVNASAGVGEIAWLWHNATGVLKRQVGGVFVVPDGYTLITATRRWESSTKVVLRYYIGAELIGEVDSTDADIQGGILGTTSIGGRGRGSYPLTVNALFDRVGGFGDLGPIGYGVSWGSGWYFDIASGNVPPTFGSVTLLEGNAGTPRLPGPLGDTDYSMGFLAAADQYNGGNVHNADTTHDLLLSGHVWFDDVTVSRDLVDKNYAGGGGAPGYLLCLESDQLALYVSDGVDFVRVSANGLKPRTWYAYNAVMSRAAVASCIAVCPVGTDAVIMSALASTSAVGSLLNAADFLVGNTGIYTAGNTRMKSLFVATGAGAAGAIIGDLWRATIELADIVPRQTDFFDGEIDELRVLDYELTREEIEATWLRLSQYQPDGYRHIRDLFQPGIPISDDPMSKVQRDLQSMGQALGYGSAQIENFRANMMPDRAYGPVLERWEGIAEEPPHSALDSTDKRRTRVTSHFGKRHGVSPPGVTESLVEVLDTGEENIEVIAFDNTIHDKWIGVETERWQHSGVGALITKNGGVDGVNDASAMASTSFVGDCAIRFMGTTNGKTQFAGLSKDTFTGGFLTADFGILLDNSGEVRVYESGALKLTLPAVAWVAGQDVFEVRRRGTVLTYFKNGSPIYSSTAASIERLFAVVSLFHTGEGFSGVRVIEGTAREVPVVWVKKANVTAVAPMLEAYGARLKKTGGLDGVNDAGASSATTFAGDGYIEALPDTTGTGRCLGLSKEDTSVTFQTIEFMWAFEAGAGANAWEDGAQVYTGGAFVVGDVFRIERTGTTVRYSKNGVVVYTSTKASTGALRIDSTIFALNGVIDGIRMFDAGSRVAIEWQSVINLRADGDELRMQAPANVFAFDNETHDALRVQMPAELPQRHNTGSNPFNGLHTFVSLEPVLLPSGAEAGIFFWDWANRNLLLFGLRYTGAAYQVGYQRYRSDGTAGDAAWQVLAATSLTKHWLRLMPYSGAFAGTMVEQPYNFSWSTTGNQESQLTTQENIIWRRHVGWWGLYVRGFGGGFATPVDVRFAESRFRNSLGTRPFHWYAIRNPDLAGSPDFLGATNVAKKLRHAFTHAAVAPRRSFLCDDPLSVCDGGPLGGI